jgi:hypothetical protein
LLESHPLGKIKKDFMVSGFVMNPDLSLKTAKMNCKFVVSWKRVLKDFFSRVHV